MMVMMIIGNTIPNTTAKKRKLLELASETALFAGFVVSELVVCHGVVVVFVVPNKQKDILTV